MIRTAPCLVGMPSALLSANAVSEPAAATVSETDAIAERLLLAIGGRSAWASVTTTILYSDQYRQGDTTVVGAISTIDHQQPRVRIDVTGPGVRQVRVIESHSDRAVRLDRPGSRPEKIVEDPLARDLRNYTEHVFRTLQRIAIRDPDLRLATGRKGSLDVYEGSNRIAWYQLDARGEPYAMGAHADSVGVICGPWEIEKRGIRHPLWVSRPDGSWRLMPRSLAVNARVDDEFFTLPLAADQ